jgi:signal transduction histidine kinase
LADFLTLAGGLEKPGDIQKLLELLGDTAGADGVVYWRLAPGSVLTEDERRGRFFPVASWCRFEDVLPWYYLPADSVTGRAWLARTRKAYDYVPSIEADLTIPSEARQSLAARWKMISCASVPITASTAPISGVTFYKRQFALNEDKVKDTLALVQQLPPLYALLGDRHALAFLSELNRTLHPLAKEAREKQFRLSTARKRLAAVCDLMTKHFAAIEASVLLTEESASGTRFKVQARRWGWPSPPYADEYVAGQGLTGWVLKNGKSMRILDLAKYREDKDWLLNEYKALEWKDLLDIREQLRRKFDLRGESRNEDLPMASFVCAPIAHGRLLGVVRCCGREKSPWSYEDVDLRVLELAASFIGGWWEDLLEYVDPENLVRIVTRLHRKAGEMVMSERKGTEQLLQITLERVMQAIPGVDHGSVRLVDKEKNDLYYKVFAGPLWRKGSPREVAQRRTKRFSLGQQSAGTHVVSRKEAYIVNDPETDPFDVTVLKEVLKRLYVPIRIDTGIVGVLDLGRTANEDFTQGDAIVAEYLAAQMGLYLNLDQQFQQRLHAQAKLREEQEAQLRTFENLRHQVYGPAGTAAMALDRLCQLPNVPGDLLRDLAIARGDALRAAIMVRSLDLFAALAADRVPPVKKERLTANWLKHRLDELAVHQGYLSAPSQQISFDVQEKGMECLGYNPVHCDLNLLEHAVSNLLENARKYSGKACRVVVQCGSMDHDRMFYISVQNSGLRIDPRDVPKMPLRLWRSDAAWQVVAEGTGIGLYLVDAIMQAHKGRLHIAPTNSSNVNEIRLIIPAGMTN